MRFKFEQDYANNFTKDQEVELIDEGAEFLVDGVALINKEALLEVGHIIQGDYDQVIRVGDEVQSNYSTNTYIVTGFEEDLLLCMLGNKVQANKVHRTGRHFDEIKEVLNKWRN